ncbi:hypothetical protein [Devosia alba]|uniref:hypothetical protein n=1 Tax=Devosia alba TaxID=3152360 RepID=UPI003263C625
MGDLIEFESGLQRKGDKCQELYFAFRLAREKADLTRRLDDDVAACKAWADWAEEYFEISRRA